MKMNLFQIEIVMMFYLRIYFTLIVLNKRVRTEERHLTSSGSININRRRKQHLRHSLIVRVGLAKYKVIPIKLSSKTKSGENNLVVFYIQGVKKISIHFTILYQIG